jgi:branched-chain amino acid transport system permease protein
MDIFIQQVINGLVLGSMYALVALGYTMVYGIINLINFAHGEVLMVGALTSWSVIVALQDAGLPGWLPEGDEPWVYDARIRLRLRSGRRRG